MKREGIPTKSQGVQFRSRLEARWAEFFTLLGWRWEYEPFDLEGWIPDFALCFDADPILVEVKPFLKLPEVPNEITQKIDTTSWEGEVLLVGATIDFDRGWSGITCGLLRDNGYQPTWWDAEITTCDYCSKRTPHTEEGVWGCRNTKGCRGRKIYGNPGDLLHLWKEAGNAVQWRAP